MRKISFRSRSPEGDYSGSTEFLAIFAAVVVVSVLAFYPGLQDFRDAMVGREKVIVLAAWQE